MTKPPSKPAPKAQSFKEYLRAHGHVDKTASERRREREEWLRQRRYVVPTTDRDGRHTLTVVQGDDAARGFPYYFTIQEFLGLAYELVTEQGKFRHDHCAIVNLGFDWEPVSTALRLAGQKTPRLTGLALDIELQLKPTQNY